MAIIVKEGAEYRDSTDCAKCAKNMGRLSIGLLLSLIAFVFLGIFMVKFVLKAIFFVFAALLLIAFVVVLTKRL